MPITVEVVGSTNETPLKEVFDYFRHVDETFSTYKDESEISRINRGEISWEEFSPEMKEVFDLSKQTKLETEGYFDIITPQGLYDPSGLVKGWAIYKAALLLKERNYNRFFIDAGGDVQVSGKNGEGNLWSVGIRHPFEQDKIVKVLHLTSQGIATSGTYIRGQHIYNPHQPKRLLTEIVSLTLIGPNVYEADRFATAAFAMGRAGINFIERLSGFEGYMIDKHGIATQTSGFAKYTQV